MNLKDINDDECETVIDIVYHNVDDCRFADVISSYDHDSDLSKICQLNNYSFPAQEDLLQLYYRLEFKGVEYNTCLVWYTNLVKDNLTIHKGVQLLLMYKDLYPKGQFKRKAMYDILLQDKVEAMHARIPLP